MRTLRWDSGGEEGPEVSVAEWGPRSTGTLVQR